MLRVAAGTLLAAFGAYALSFAVELPFDAPLANAALPMMVWGGAAVLAWRLAWELVRSRWLLLPCLLLAVGAMLSGLLGRASSWVVAVVLLGQAGLVWVATRPIIVKSDGVSA